MESIHFSKVVVPDLTELPILNNLSEIICKSRFLEFVAT